MQESRPKLSVIVPMWGVEKYIEKCARSLFESTLEDIEFVFVDDCTPDKSIDVLNRVMEDYPIRKSQSKIIHHEVNKGLPQARKTGFEASCGEWITYCDSDDWVHPEMYEKMLETATWGGYDLVCCDFVYQSDEKVYWSSNYDSEKNELELRLDMLSLNVSNAVWNKIVHRRIYDNGIYFPIQAMDEDDVFTSQFAFYSTKIGYVHDVLYYHYANPESMTHETNIERQIKHLKARIENCNWIIQFLESKNEDSLVGAINRYKINVKFYVSELSKHHSRDIYREVNSYMLFSKDIPFTGRMHYLVFLFFHPLYSRANQIIYVIKKLVNKDK